MRKYFNTTGPCYPDKHYMLVACDRCRGVVALIDREQYFVIYAARQTGKTTLLLELARDLIELKLRYDAKTYAAGITQLADSMERLGGAEGWLVVFDRRKSIAWSKKLFWKTQAVGAKTIHIVGCGACN